jgi:hypothetical protein
MSNRSRNTRAAGTPAVRWSVCLTSFGVEVASLIGTAASAIGLATTGVGNTIQSKHEMESFLMLVRRESSDAIQGVLRLGSGVKHHAR